MVAVHLASPARGQRRAGKLACLAQAARPAHYRGGGSPTLSGPVLTMPSVAGTRTAPVLRRPEPSRPAVNVLPLGGTSEGPTGRITGLLRPAPDRRHYRRKQQPVWQDDGFDPVALEAEAAGFDHPIAAPPRTAPVVTRPAVTPRAVLTRAVDDYVGEPVAPAASASPPVPASPFGSDDPFFTTIAAFMPNRGQALAAPGSASPEQQPPPQPTPQHRTPTRRQRANLGQSRRRGIGQALPPQADTRGSEASSATQDEDPAGDGQGEPARDVEVVSPVEEVRTPSARR